MFWGDAPQIVKLPVKVEGPPTKQTSLIRWRDVDGHNQYFMVLTYVFKVAKVIIRKEKAAKVMVCDELSGDSSGSDVDDDENFTPGGGSVGGSMDW